MESVIEGVEACMLQGGGPQPSVFVPWKQSSNNEQ